MCFSFVEDDTYTWISFSCMYFYGFLRAVAQRVFYVYNDSALYFLAHIYCRILALRLMLYVVKKTTLN